MKRRKYLVECLTTGHRVTRFAWNSSLTLMRDMVRLEAAKKGGEWYQSAANTQTDALKRHTRGEFTWTRTDGQGELKFTITLLEE